MQVVVDAVITPSFVGSAQWNVPRVLSDECELVSACPARGFVGPRGGAAQGGVV